MLFVSEAYKNSLKKVFLLKKISLLKKIFDCSLTLNLIGTSVEKSSVLIIEPRRHHWACRATFLSVFEQLFYK